MRLQIFVSLLLGLYLPQMNLAALNGRSISRQQCRPITIPLCQNIGYNKTSMPNQFNHMKQEEAGMEVHQFYPLVEVKCSEHLKFFLCSMYVPICLDDFPKPLQPCRGICEHARDGCKPLMERYGFVWPENLDCDKLPVQKANPEPDELCMAPESLKQETQTKSPHIPRKPDRTDRFPDEFVPPNFPPPSSICKCQCESPFVKMETGAKYPMVGNISSCAYPCFNPFLSDNQQGQHQRFLTPLIGAFAIACCVSTLITVLTFLIDRDRFRYPERPIFIISLCYFMVSIGYIIRLVWGHQEVACDGSAHGYIVRTSNAGNNGSPQCTVTFLFIYFFGMASSCWWVVLSLTWFLAAGLKWSPEAISKYSAYFHIAAWLIPSIKTILILAFHAVDGDSLTGICSVGNTSLLFLRGFIIGPLCVYLVLGMFFLGAGFVSLIRIHNLVKAQQGTNKIQKLTRLVAKIGIFSVLYTIPATVLLGALFYEQHFRELWESSMMCECLFKETHNQAMYILATIKTGCSMLVGITTLFWIWSPKTLHSWHNFFSRKFCCESTSYGQPAYQPAEAIIIKSHTDISSQAAYSSSRHPLNGYPMNHV